VTRQPLIIALALMIYTMTASSAVYAESASSNCRMKASVLSNAGENTPSCVFSLGEPVVGRANNAGTYLKMGFIPASHRKILSISLTPDTWDIGSVDAGKAATMSSEQSITITNEGNVRLTPELIITGAPGWTASELSGRETFSLRALICGQSDIPVESNFEEEDSILIDGKKASDSTFAYPGSTQNGKVISAKQKRKMLLQFHSPGITELSDNEIQITVTAQEHRRLP